MGANLTAVLTGEYMVAKYTGGRSAPTTEEIAHLAYQFYQERGRLEGLAMDDWLAAEKQLTHHYR